MRAALFAIQLTHRQKMGNAMQHPDTLVLGRSLRRRALSIAVASTLAVGMMPALALAEGTDLSTTAAEAAADTTPPPFAENGVALAADAGDAPGAATGSRALSATGLSIAGGVEGTDFTVDDAAKKIVFTSGKAMTVSGTSAGYTLEVAAGVHATLTLDNVTIRFTRTGDAQRVPLNIVTNVMDLGGEERTAPATDGAQITNPTSLHLILADGSTNTLTAGASAPGIRCGEGSRLVIDDSVVNSDENGNHIVPVEGRVPADLTLENGLSIAKGDPLYKLDAVRPGKLISQGGIGGAGIGSAPHENAGTIIIDGGVIEASAYGNSSSSAETYNKTGAGIGGSYGGGGMDITINGGVIVATGSYHGAGIGAGCTSLPASTTVSVPQYEKLELPGAIRTREYKAGQRCRSITINGGNVEAWGYVHGFSLGDGCGGQSSAGHSLTITGGNVTPKKDLAGASDTHTGGLLGASGLDIIVQGGSFNVPYFGFASSPASTSVTDGRGHTLQMVTINLDGFDELKGAQLKNLTVTVNGAPLTDADGKRYDYGMPYGVDAAGCVYFWLPSVVNGEPLSKQTVSIGSFETSVLDPDTGERDDVTSDFDFVVPNPGTGSLAKRYVEIDIDEYVEKTEDLYKTLFKRYDGTPVGLEGGLVDTIAGFGVPAGEPKGKFLTSSATMTVSSQRTHDKNGDETTDAIQAGATFSDVGDYDLIVESKEYSGDASFAKSFWGHKLYFSAAITPADSRVSVLNHVIDYDTAVTRAAKPVKGVTFTAHVMPRDIGEAPEAKTCASPDGTVQFYANGVAVGDPVKAVAAPGLTESGYHYSVATLVWDKTGVQIPRNPDGTIEITAKFNGGTNYLASESNDDRTTEELQPDFPFGSTPEITVRPQNPDPSVPVPDISPEGVAKPGEPDPDATDKDIANTLHSTADDSVSYPVRPNARPLTPEGGLRDWVDERYDIPAGCEVSSITVKNADGTPAAAIDPSKPGSYQVDIVVRDPVTGNTTTLSVDYAVVNPPAVNIPVTPDGPKDVPSDKVDDEPNGGTVHGTGHDTVSRPVKPGHVESPDSLKEWAESRFDIPEGCTMAEPTITQDGKPLASIDCGTPGRYEVSFVVTDERGNSTTVNVDYRVTNPPAVTIPGADGQPKPPAGSDDPTGPGAVEEGPGNGTVHTTIEDTLSRPAAPGQKDTPASLKDWADDRYDIPDDCEIALPVIKDADGNPVDEIDRGKPGRYEVTFEVRDPQGNSTQVVVDYTVHGAPDVTPTDPDKSDLVEKEPPRTDPDGTVHEDLEDRKPVDVTPDASDPAKPITKDDIRDEVEDRYDIPEGSEVEITIIDPDGNLVDEIDPRRPGVYEVSVVIRSPEGDTVTIGMHWVVSEAPAALPGTGEGSGGAGGADADDDERKRLAATRLAETGDEGAAGVLARYSSRVFCGVRAGARRRPRMPGEDA